MVYNEEKNIIDLLESISNQKLRNIIVEKIIVVSSGSTDRTSELVLKYRTKDGRACLLVQDEREGKPSAINKFLKNSTEDIVIMSSGDVIFGERTVEKLITLFRDKTIGMTSTSPVPTNKNEGFMGFVASTHWKMHNILGRHGESVAFRKSLVGFIPTNVVADEAYVEVMVQRSGLKVVHVNDAIILNKGPETSPEFLKQIRRHFLGHLQLEFGFHYSVSSMTKRGISDVLRELIMLSVNNLDKIPYCLGYLSLEMLGRILGTFDFILGKRNPVLWDMVRSTKSLSTNSEHLPRIKEEKM